MSLVWTNKRGRTRGIEARKEEIKRGINVERGREEGRKIIKKEKEGRKGGSLGLTVTGF